MTKLHAKSKVDDKSGGQHYHRVFLDDTAIGVERQRSYIKGQFLGGMILLPTCFHPSGGVCC